MSDQITNDMLRELLDRPEFIDRFRLPRLYVNGLEVTQAIQYYHAAEHLTDASDRGADNSVTLVTGKPAWVRVYVRSTFFAAQIAGVTGTLEVSRSNWFFYSPLGTLNPQPPATVTARRVISYADERGNIGASLNFIIPAEMMCGSLRLKVNLTAPSGETAEYTTYVSVHLQQTLRVRGIMVGYNGPASSAAGAPNLTLAAPSPANLATTAAWTLLTYPVRSAASFTSAGSITWNLPLTDAPSCPGCCTPNWVALNAAVQAQRVADGNRTDVLYYGLMAAGIPMGPIIGCNSGGVSTGTVNDGVTMAHELGHACGLPHAPCGTPGDPNYPAYEPYDPANSPNASIGEYGLDISTGNIPTPSLFKDMMAYCGPRWISLYNYGRLTNNSNLEPVTRCVDRPWWRDWVIYDPLLIPEKWLPDPPPEPTWRQRMVAREPVISIIGVMHSENEVEIQSVMRLEAVPEVHNGKSTQVVAELVGEQGVISRAPAYRLESHGGGCGCNGEGDAEGSYPFLFQAFVPDKAAGQALRLRQGDQELWVRKGSGKAPRISGLKVSARENELHAEWRFEGASEGTEFWLQWSQDEGKTWNGLASMLREPRAVADISGVPSGRLLVRVLGSDGFYTAASRAVGLTIRERAPVVSILSPRDGITLISGNSMRLWGAVTTFEEEEGEEEKLDARWLLDGQEVAQGLDVFVTVPGEGEHKLTLLVRTDDGRGEASVRFTAVAMPKEYREG